MSDRLPERQKEKPHCKLAVILYRGIVAKIVSPGSVRLVSYSKIKVPYSMCYFTHKPQDLEKLETQTRKRGSPYFWL